MTIICHKGRIDAPTHSDAACAIWDRFPDAINVTILGPMPDGLWEWVVLTNECLRERFAKKSITM